MRCPGNPSQPEGCGLLAPSFAETRWDEIARLYELLDAVAPSPLNTLNRAIAIAEWKGPEAGLAVLQALEPPAWLLGYYLWDATLGELYRRSGDRDRALSHLARALDAAPIQAEKALLTRRIAECTELGRLDRWIDQSIEAATVAEALAER